MYFQICESASSQLNLGPEIELLYEAQTNQFLLDDVTDDDAATAAMSTSPDVIQQHTTSVLTQLRDWRHVASVSRANPDVIVEVRLKVNQHALMRRWITCHRHDEFTPLVDESQVSDVARCLSTRGAFISCLC